MGEEDGGDDAVVEYDDGDPLDESGGGRGGPSISSSFWCFLMVLHWR